VTDIREAVAEITASVVAKPRAARDPVNQPTINNWVEAIGDRNPIYTDEAAARDAGHPGIVAPPAMIQVWTMFGLGGERPTDDPMGPMMKLFDDAGYVGVVATNCEQTYHRYLRPGEEVSVASEMRDVVGPKQTALGEGWFINQHITWRVGDEDVAEMEWRILKFKPRESEAAGAAVPADQTALIGAERRSERANLPRHPASDVKRRRVPGKNYLRLPPVGEQGAADRHQ
jgi:uncharacterized protein